MTFSENRLPLFGVMVRSAAALRPAALGPDRPAASSRAARASPYRGSGRRRSTGTRAASPGREYRRREPRHRTLLPVGDEDRDRDADRDDGKRDADDGE